MSIKEIAGITITEMLVTTAVFALIVAASGHFFSTTSKNVYKQQKKTEALEKLRQVFSVYMEPDLTEANEIVEAGSHSIIFIVDSNRMPSYDPDADPDGDGIVNLKDPDDDNDASLILPPTAQFRAGYDLKDDDETGDGLIDMRVKYYLSGAAVYKDVSYNEQAWGGNVKKLLDGITYFNIVYWGAKKEDLGKNIDLGNDGEAGTSDEGEGDGLISAREIDWVEPPIGHGDRSGAIDTENEFRYVASVYMEMAYDKNGDGVEDARLSTELSPPLLILKTRQ